MGKRSVASFVSAILAVVWWVMAVGVAIVTVILLVSPIMPLGPRDDGSSAMYLGLPASFSIEASRVTAATLGVAAAEIREAKGVLRMPVSSRSAVVGTVIFAIVMLSVLWYGLTQLRRVLVSLREERPFSPDNAVRIRRIAYVVIGGELLRAGFTFAANLYVTKYFVADGVRFVVEFNLSFPTLVCGLIVFVLAEVFRAGARLEEDRSLTI